MSGRQTSITDEGRLGLNTNGSAFVGMESVNWHCVAMCAAWLLLCLKREETCMKRNVIYEVGGCVRHGRCEMRH